MILRSVSAKPTHTEKNKTTKLVRSDLFRWQYNPAGNDVISSAHWRFSAKAHWPLELSCEFSLGLSRTLPLSLSLHRTRTLAHSLALPFRFLRSPHMRQGRRPISRLGPWRPSDLPLHNKKAAPSARLRNRSAGRSLILRTGSGALRIYFSFFIFVWSVKNDSSG